MLNNYNSLAEEYKKTSSKPDKLYSTLPTLLKIAGTLDNKTVLDLGCGSGFFTKAFASRGAKKVIGIDSSEEQIKLAFKDKQLNTDYIRGDIFKTSLPKANIILAPYVINYAQNNAELSTLLQNIYQSLENKGKVILVIDLPTGKDLKKFGAIKTLGNIPADGEKITIELFNQNQFICKLNAFYFKPETIEKALKEIGFKKVIWHTPIISNRGLQEYGKDFWEGYTEGPELGYVSAEKITGQEII